MPLRKVKEFLNRRHVKYVVIEHQSRDTGRVTFL